MPVPKPADAEKPLEVRLPEPGRLTLKYDIPGSEAEGRFFLQMASYEIAGWEGIDNIREPRVANGKSRTLLNLAPGKYTITRSKNVKLDDMGIGAMLDRQNFTIAPGGAAEAVFVRDRGAAITGRAEWPGRDTSPGALVSINTADSKDNPLFARFDATKTGPGGVFTTERLLPGEYTVTVQAYLPEPKGGRFSTGLRAPAFVGSAKVTVPAKGQPEAVVITLKPRGAK